MRTSKPYGADFTPYNQQPIGFKVSLAYSASGNILEKDVDGTLLINGGTTSVSYQNVYDYTGRPHTVSEAGDYTYDWDLNGNMRRRINHNSHNHDDRYFCWDEENRLSAVRDVSDLSQSSLYIYDAGGERVWKLTGEEMLTQVNGQTVSSNIFFEKTLYTGPYLVMTESDYTKHYYIEGERVCSKIGGGFGPASVQPADSVLYFIYSDFEHVQTALSNLCGRHLECVDYEGEWEIHKKLDPAGNIDDSLENLQYFYHPDHLGSAAVISFTSGRAYQHLQYFPFGELFVSQRNSSFDSRYKFSAKELDNETGYSYFGARYYDSDLSSWLSVDPLASERSWVSPYSYCQNNPMNRIDPTGALDWKPLISGGRIYLQAEKGDNAETLKNFFGGSENAKNYVDEKFIADGKSFGEGMTVPFKGTDVYSKAVSDAYSHPENYTETGNPSDDNYNCHASLFGTIAKEFYNLPPLSYNIRNILISSVFKSGNSNNAVFGKSLVTYGQDHTAIFFGKSKDGTVYIFTKNGLQMPPTINKASENININGTQYGPVRNIFEFDNNTYNVKINKFTGTRIDDSQGTGIYNLR